MIEIFTINQIEFKLISYNLGLGRDYYALKSKSWCRVFKSKLEALDYAKFWAECDVMLKYVERG